MERFENAPLNFSTKVTKISLEQDITLLDALIEVVEDNEIDISDVKNLISPCLKERLYLENLSTKKINSLF